MLVLVIEDSSTDVHIVVHYRLRIVVGQWCIVCLTWGYNDEIEMVHIDQVSPSYFFGSPPL